MKQTIKEQLGYCLVNLTPIVSLMGVYEYKTPEGTLFRVTAPLDKEIHNNILNKRKNKTFDYLRKEKVKRILNHNLRFERTWLQIVDMYKQGIPLVEIWSKLESNPFKERNGVYYYQGYTIGNYLELV